MPNSRPQAEYAPPQVPPLFFRRRWWLAWTLFGSTVINYINRQALSVLAPVISQELLVSHTPQSRIFGAFQISYAVTWLLGGVILDIVGTRAGTLAGRHLVVP